MFKRMYIWSILIILSLSLSCIMATASTPKDTLVIGKNTSGLITCDPAASYGNTGVIILNNTYETIIDTDVGEDGQIEIIPAIAESWEVSKDNKTWTFYLREGVVFENGDPLKADAVVYSLQRVLKLGRTNSWYLELIGMEVDKIWAPDDYTVKIVTDGSPSNVVLTILAATISGIVNPNIAQEHEVDGDMGTGYLTDYGKGASSGPFYVEEWERNVKVVLRANENYWRGAPEIKTVIFQDIQESTDQLLQIKSGDIDVAVNLNPDQALSLKDSPDVRIVSTASQRGEYLGMNVAYEPFADVRVRTAVKYALDYDAIMEIAKGGFAINNQQFLAKGYFGYVENNPYHLDIEKAKALLAEAGYEDGFDVELSAYARDKDRAVMIQNQLAQVGIRAEMNIGPKAQLVAKYKQQGLQLVLAQYGMGYPDPGARANAFANYRKKQVAWRLTWYDDYAANLTEAADKETNEDRRFQMYRDLSDYWLMYSPMAKTFQEVKFWAVRNEVKDFEEGSKAYPMCFFLWPVYKE